MVLILFIILINDINDAIKECDIGKFANDSKIGKKKNKKQRKKKNRGSKALQNDINQLFK